VAPFVKRLIRHHRTQPARPRSAWLRWCQLLQVLGVGLLVSMGVMVATSLSATADSFPGAGGCGTLPGDNNVYLDCVVPPTTTPYTTYTDGQGIDVSMGPNSAFAGSPNGAQIKAFECEYTGANPTNYNQCYVQTAGGDFPYNVNPDGSFDYASDFGGDAVTVYGLPDATFPDSNGIQCDDTHACVLWVGNDYLSGFTSGPHFFSSPFYVTGAVVPTTTIPPSTTTTEKPATTTTSTTTPSGGTTTTTTSTTSPAGTSTTTTAPATAGGGGTSSGGDGGASTVPSDGVSGATAADSASGASLAFTGSPSLLWLMLLGGMCLAAGTVGRRAALRIHP
jgi:hypothetical protein